MIRLILIMVLTITPAFAECPTDCQCEAPVKMTWWQRIKTDPKKSRIWRETVGVFGYSIELIGVGVQLAGKAIQGEI